MSGLLDRFWGRSGVFVRKELREIRRDRKTILLSLVMPVLIYPLMFSFMTRLERQEARKTETALFRVVVTGDAEAIREEIRRAPGLTLTAEMDDELLLERLREGVVNVWIDARPGSVAADTAAPGVRLVYHSPESDSRVAMQRVRAAVDAARAEEQERRFRRAGGAGALGPSLDVREIDVATREETGGATAGRLVPFLLIFTLFIGGASLSVDVVAGEKERGTLETLYLTPVRREEIARAKFTVVTGATMLTGVLNLASLVACYRLGLIGEPGTESGLALSASGVALCFVLILPLAAMVGGLLLGISAFARSLKEAQYYVMPVMLLMFVPGVLSMTQDVRLSPFTALIPVANVSIALRDALVGAVPVGLVLLVIAASVAWAGLVLRWTAGVLSREDTILGFDPEPLFGKTHGGRRRAAWLGIAGTALGFFYVGQLVQAWNLKIGLALSLWVLLPAMAALALRFAWAGGSLTELLSLRRAPAGALLGAALLGVGVVIPIVRGLMALQTRFLPAPETAFEVLEEGIGDMSLPLMLVLMAFSPGVCEELVFRGAFLGLLRRTGPTRVAVLGSAAFFAAIHLSVFRFLPTFLLGVILATLVVRTRSIFPAMIFHAFYNGSTLLASRGDELPTWMDGVPGWAGSLALLAAGAWLVTRASAQAQDATRPRASVPLQADEVDSRSDH